MEKTVGAAGALLALCLLGSCSSKNDGVSGAGGAAGRAGGVSGAGGSGFGGSDFGGSGFGGGALDGSGGSGLSSGGAGRAGASGAEGHADAGGNAGGNAGGQAGLGNVAGQGGASACNDLIEDAGCADAKQTTRDFQSGVFGACGHWTDNGNGTGWILYDAFGGFGVDVATGRGWHTSSKAGSLNRDDSAKFCEGLELGPLKDWRLPSVDEARSLGAGCAETAPGGSCPIADPSCLTKSCAYNDDCESCKGSAGHYYCRPEISVCLTFHTSSACADCDVPSSWTYGVINGNFYPQAASGGLWPVCVMDAVPRGIPCEL
jgi:hypothetical protein